MSAFLSDQLQEVDLLDFVARLPINMMLCDIDMRVTWVNEGIASMFHVTPEDMMGQLWYDLVPPMRERRPVYEQVLQGAHFDFPCVAVTFPLETRYFDVHYRPIHHRDGSVAGMIVVARDISARQRAEDASREQLSRLALINRVATHITAGMSVDAIIERTVAQISEQFPCLRVAYSLIDTRGQLNVIHAKEPHGMPPLQGLSADLTIAPAYLAALQRRETVIVEDVAQDPRFVPLAAAMAAGRTHAVLDIPVFHPDGLVGLLCFDAPEPRRWSHHEMATLTEMAEYLALALRDAHLQQQRQQAQAALERKTHQLHAITQTMTQFLAEENWGEASQRLVRHALEQTQSAYGFIGVFVNATLRILAHTGLVWDANSGRDLYEEAVQTYQQRGYLEFAQLEHVCGHTLTTHQAVIANHPTTDPRAGGSLPPGHPALDAFLGVPICNGAEVVGMFGLANRAGGYTAAELSTLEPLTQAAGVLYDSYLRRERERHLDDQLRQAQKMEALGTLAGGIAHDFNNILAAILGNVELCLMDTLEENQERHLHNIAAAGTRAATLVRQILTFSRMEAVRFEAVQLSSVVHEALNIARATIPANIAIRQALQEDCAPIMADATQIHQIVLNLCANASHAMEETGGIVAVTVYEVPDCPPEVPVSARSCMVLSVTDNGDGIAPENLEKIFDPFFTTQEVGKGTGLGLAVVHGIVHSHNGAITVDSVRGTGTTFTLFFPTVDKTDIPVARHAKEVSRRGTGHILIVEDERALADLYRDFLQKAGYTVTVCKHGLEALTHFTQHPDHFDVVFTDQAMPYMTGKQLSQELLKIRPDLPVILATGYSEVMTKDEAYALGIRHYMMKPLRLGKLQEIIAACLKKA